MLTIEYKLTEEELVNYSFYTGWTSPAKRSYRARIWAIYLAIYLFLVLGIFYGMDKGQLESSSLIIAGIGLAGVVILLLFRMKIHFQKQAKKLIAESGEEKVIPKTTLTINENGMFGKTEHAEVKYSWNAFQKKVVINNCYYLYINAKQAVVIPMRAFLSRQEKDEFDGLIAKYFPLQAELNTIQNA